MPYHYLPAANASELIQQIASVVADAGWTITHYQTGSTEWLVLKHAQTNYLHLTASSSDTVLLNCTRDFSSSGGFSGQTNGFRINNNANTHTKAVAEVLPTLSAHIFVGTDPAPYLHVAWEVQPGYYRHINIGALDLFVQGFNATFFDTVNNPNAGAAGNSYTDYYGLSVISNSNIYSTVSNTGGLDFFDSEQNLAFYATNDSGTSYRRGGCALSDVDTMYGVGPNNITGRTLLNPLEYFCNTIDGLMAVGVVPNMNYVNITYYDAGDEVTVGSDVWKIFPLIRKGEPVRENTGGSYGYDSEFTKFLGFAYLKD